MKNIQLYKQKIFKKKVKQDEKLENISKTYKDIITKIPHTGDKASLDRCG